MLHSPQIQTAMFPQTETSTTAMLPRTSLKSEGFSAEAVLKFVNNLDKNGAHSFVLTRHGRVVSEGYWNPYAPNLYHSMFSVTKSFTSSAIGFAVDEGLVKLDDLVVDYFHDKLTTPPCDNMRKTTVRNLLTMATGHGDDYDMLWEDYAVNEKDINKDADDVYKFLTTYVPTEPGTIFHYNSGASFMLGAIIKQVSGLSVIDYLRPRLFEPLGIDARADVNKYGLNAGGTGFQMRTEDLAKFGIFYLNKGKSGGCQLLSEKWINEATSKQIDSSAWSEDENWASGYGYQFWRLADGKTYRADGMHGQFSIVAPYLDVVLAITAGTLNNGQIVRDAMELLETVGPDYGEEADSLTKLNAKLKSLHLPLPEGEILAHRPIPKTRYALSNNELGFTHIQIDNEVLKIWQNGDLKAPFLSTKIGHNQWTRTTNGDNRFGKALLIGELATSGAWIKDNLVIEIIVCESVCGYKFEFSFQPHHVVIDVHRIPDGSPRLKILGVEAK